MGSNKPHRLRRFVKAAVATLAAFAATATMGVSSAQAAVDNPTLASEPAWTGGVIAGFFPSGLDEWLGSYNVGNEKGYCYESGIDTGTAAQYASPTMGWTQKEDSALSRRIGWLLAYPGQEDDALDNAGVAYAIHILSGIDIGQQATRAKLAGLSDSTPVGLWHNVTAGGTRTHEGNTTLGAVRQKANQLWAQSESTSKSGNLNVKEIQYTDAQRHLHTKEIWYKDGNGQFASTDVIVTLDDTGKFDAAANGMYGGTVSADGKTWTGKTQPSLGAAGLQLPFTATGDGGGKYNVSYKDVWYTYSYPQNAQGFQHMAKRGTYHRDPVTVESHAYNVQWSFQPQAVTVTDPKKLEPGDTPVDKVTSSVGDLISGTGADGTTHNTWNANTEVKAEGYYYASEDEGILQPVKRNANETVDQYLARVNKLYGNPVATGSTVFTAAGQTNTVRAQANGRDYTVPSDSAGYYGTWVWVIRKNAQAQPDRITGDFVAEAGNKDEASLHHIKMRVSSQTANATITDNGELADRITVNGLPKNLGTFKGFDALGWSADETRATVKVYWAGEKYGEASNQDDDAQYQPSTKDAPADDAHHKLIGTYTYDLADLIKADKTYRNGGTLTLNVGGENATKTVDGKTPSLKAKGTGYYIFVFSYAGCGRVSAATSAYDDVYERIFVQQHKSLGLTSHATPNRVKVGEKFHDTVTITGEYAARYLKGAYVEFNAYEPVSGEPDLTVGKLTSEKVNLTDEQIHDISVGKQVNVSSSEVTADKAGTVNWQATLFAGDGTRLATHSFGQADEAVEVTGNGKVESVSQKQGAVNGGMWDLIHVSNVTTGTNRGNVPEGSIVRVKVYKHQGEDGANEGQLVESKDFKVDTSKLRDGSNDYWFKAEMDKTYPAAGRYYWTEELIDNFGNTLDKGAYGDQDEQTDVQKYETDTAKKWLSDDNGDYSEKTVKTFDILTQTWFNDWGSDAHRDTEGDETQSHGVTNDGVKAQFSIWSQGASKADDKQVVTGKANALPNIDKKAAKAGRMYQKVKSETFTLSNLEPGTYYYGLRVTSDQDAANLKKYVGEDSDGLVYEAPKRDARESFDIVRVTSDTAEKLWTTDQSHVADTLHVQGTLPKGSAYQVEVWSVKDGKAVEKVSESAKHTLDKDVTDGDITVSDMDMPKTAGTYQFRHKVWTPDTLGGDPKVDDGSVIIDPDATTGYRYPTRELLFEGDNVASERFEVVTISTDVTRVEGGYVTSDGEHYVDVTNGAKVGDHVDIEGHMLEGYKLGFELYRRNGTADEQSDTLVRTIDPVALTDAQTTLESALVDLTDPGDYYWVTVFTKPDGSAWKPDGETEVRSAKRVKSESFHAVRITTTTAKWTSKGGTTRDVAKIEGCLPDDAIIRFDLHDYTTGNVVVEGVEKTLKELGYKGCVNGGDTVQEVTGPEVTLPDAVDHYFVEHVRFKDQDKTNDFHRGNDRVKHESTRTIDATTDTSVEYTLGSAVADHANLLNIKYSTSDGKDIRDDLTGPLTATWELYRQSAGSDTSKDVKVADVDKDGVKLESGQTEVESSPYRPTEVGLYYYVISIHDEEGNVIKRGVAREPSESFRIIKAESKTDRVVAENHDTTDAVTITGPVAEGTMVSWTLMRHGDGDASTDTVEAEYDIPEHGATLVTADQAKDALNGKTITVKPSKVFKPTKAGVNYYWVFKLSSPARDGATGEPLKPKDAQDTSHLMTNTVSAIGEVDGDDTPAQADIVDFYEDRARTESESFNVVKVTTRVSSSEATVGDRIHDTAYITGDIPNDGYCISFEYWKQNKGDVSGDHLNSTSQCVPVPAHATTVEGPEHTAIESGVHYYRERLTEKANGREVSYGEARVPGETVKVKLPPTGVMVGGAAGVLALLATAGLGFAYVGSKRRVTGRHTATGRHAA